MRASAGRCEWNAALALYATAQRAAGRAPGTIRLHRHYLTTLAEQHRRPWTLTTEQLVAFLAVEAWAPETRKSARAAVCGFYRWGHGSGYVDDDPAAHLPAVRVPPGMPRPAPEWLVSRALVEAPPRVALMLALAAYAGLRAGEIARVHSSDVVDGRLFVKGKGGRTRVVPLAPQLVLALPTSGGWVFPNGQGSHLSPGHVSRLVSRALPEGWTAHTFRHRLATRAYAGTRDLLAVSALLGHSRPETTQRYVLLPDDALVAAITAAS
jgi:integrase/recombinase XerC